MLHVTINLNIISLPVSSKRGKELYLKSNNKTYSD